MIFRFAHPLLLLMLVVLGSWILIVRHRKRAAITYSRASELGRFGARTRGLRPRLPFFLRCGCLFFLVLAAAVPQVYRSAQEIPSPVRDIVLCLDASASMQALDFQLDGTQISRLEVVKKVVCEFIEKRETDRIGLVLFGQEAFTQCPVTLDRNLLLSLVKRIEIGMAGDRTAIGAAIALGGKRLDSGQTKSKILILLTDGRHNAGDITPEQAAQAVAAIGVKIYTIGVGGRGPAPFKVDTAFGPRTVYQQADLDERTLRSVASLGGGQYFRASDSDTLSKIYGIIDAEEKTEVKIKKSLHVKELYLWPLTAALLLLAAEILVRLTVSRGIP